MDFLHLDQRILENIFLNLSFRELTSLRLTCSRLRACIAEFLRHFASIARLKVGGIEATLPEPRHCWENELLEQLKDPRSDLIAYKHKNIFKDKYIRKSVFQADEFPHLENHSFISTITDSHLQRSIVHLNSVCWLYCSLHFNSVRPGTYLPSIVLRLEKDNFSYPSWSHLQAPDILVQVHVRQDGSEEPLSEGRIPVKDLNKWVKAKGRRGYPLIEEVPLCSSCPPKKDKWFYYHLPEFKLRRNMDLKFVFRDTENRLWKGGIEWDFFQLRKIN
eukprot:TRINITY_DN1767_c0_g1_i1.p1 TRINITY_DN1767_c0_g1~~TRINITY_DN1767_c0_g1_i1.p1  ORF type:complete len:275 (-),score=37.40 TRINITY_DN1767_c0_g1_i1:183-1007(-)